jgi:hypothetical protein
MTPVSPCAPSPAITAAVAGVGIPQRLSMPVPGWQKGEFVKLTNIASCDNFFIMPPTTHEKQNRMSVPFSQVLHHCYENSGKQQKTARHFAVLPLAARPAAQDFRGERDVVR